MDFIQGETIAALNPNNCHPPLLACMFDNCPKCKIFKQENEMKPSVLSELNKIVASRGQHSAREARELLLKAVDKLGDARCDRTITPELDAKIDRIIKLLTE